VLRELVTWQVPLSVDTYHQENMQKSLDLGVDIINDVWALRQANALEVVAKYDCGVCLMHMHGNPLTMQLSPMQEETLEPVFEFLQMQTQFVQSRGVAAHRIVIDPGIGFGKTVTQNFDILQRQKLLLDLGFPVMVGWSRKSSLGKVTGLDVADRCVPSVVAAILAIERGAKIVRVHDVAQTVSALAVWKNAPALM
jgi:dihydropteroate synthase